MDLRRSHHARPHMRQRDGLMGKTPNQIPIDWSNSETQLLLVRILKKGEIPINKGNGKIVDAYTKTRWLTKKSTTAYLTEEGREAITEILSNHWPEYDEEIAEILNSDPGFNFTVKALERYRIEHRPNRIPPQRNSKYISRQCFSAIVGDGAKDDISETESKIFPGIVKTSSDSFFRCRASEGLEIKLSGGHKIPVGEMSKHLSECVIPERSIIEGVEFAGVMPKALLIVENAGVFVDLPRPKGLFILLIPGWNSPLAIKVLKSFPSGIPVWHFGDLDDRGYRMYLKHKKELPHTVRWFIPECIEDYAFKSDALLRKKWSRIPQESDVPALVLRLAQEDKWLEQEVCCFDKRLVRELERLE